MRRAYYQTMTHLASNKQIPKESKPKIFILCSAEDGEQEVLIGLETSYCSSKTVNQYRFKCLTEFLESNLVTTLTDWVNI